MDIKYVVKEQTSVAERCVEANMREDAAADTEEEMHLQSSKKKDTKKCVHQAAGRDD